MTEIMNHCPMFDIECRSNTLKCYEVVVNQCPCISGGTSAGLTTEGTTIETTQTSSAMDMTTTYSFANLFKN